MRKPNKTKAVPTPAPAVRHHYERLGVEGYYQAAGADYQNPHLPQIAELLRRNTHRLDFSGAFDFCCGSGEVGAVLVGLGHPLPEASDPFTGGAYHRRFGVDCLPLSFEDVARQGLPGQYSAVVCSFAMHLCPPNLLFPLAWRLLDAAPVLVILTPHKRPELERFQGITLAFEDAVPTPRGKAVRLRAYGRVGNGN